MQSKQFQNSCQNSQCTLSPRELYSLAEIKQQLETLGYPLSEAIEQFIMLVPDLRKEAIQFVTRQFVFAMELHLLQMTVTFYQQANRGGFDKELIEGTIEDVKAEFSKVFEIDQQIYVDSMGKLFKLGKITEHIMGFSHFASAEETQRSLYAIPGLYQGWLKRAQLFREEQPA
jgi:hypothetical protein